jgi:hypothetical protein
LRRYTLAFLFERAEAFDADISGWVTPNLSESEGGGSVGMFKGATEWLTNYKRIKVDDGPDYRGTTSGPPAAWASRSTT